MIPIVLVTGFLGSGKTTLLTSIARRYRERRLLYLVNDFASVDVDGELVRAAGVDVLAVSGGSIFCRCLVTEFIGVLQKIAAQASGPQRPEGVFIEASGMADPRVIHRMLEETRLDRTFVIRRVVALIDPGTFHKLLQTLPAIRAQVAGADTILVSKPDCHPPEAVQAARRAARALRPDALCLDVLQGEGDLDFFARGSAPRVDGDYARCVDPDYYRFTLTANLPDLAAIRAQFKNCPDGLYRVKGFIEEDGRRLAVDGSSSGLHVREWTGSSLPAPRLACIASPQKGPEIERRWKA